jgi:hypothetical protein
LFRNLLLVPAIPRLTGWEGVCERGSELPHVRNELHVRQVMRAEEEEEKINRTRGGVVEGEDNLTGFIDRMKKISEREREREKFIDNQTDD